MDDDSQDAADIHLATPSSLPDDDFPDTPHPPATTSSLLDDDFPYTPHPPATTSSLLEDDLPDGPLVPNPCGAMTARGERCRAPAGVSGYCYFHDPARLQDRKRSSAAGGRARHGRIIGRTPPPPVCLNGEEPEDGEGGEDICLGAASLPARTPADIVRILDDEIRIVRTLERSVQRARAVAYLAMAALKAYEMTNLSERVAALEQALQARKEKTR